MSFISLPLGQWLGPFLIAWLLSGLFCWLLRRLRAHLATDLPGERRVHQRPIPRVGGIALWLSFIITFFLFLPLDFKLGGFLLGATFIFLVGLIDDFWQPRAFYKFIGQILGALILVLFGVGINFLTNPWGGIITLPLMLNLVLTVVWVVTVINALNFLDGLDGLAGSVSLAAALILALLSLLGFVAQPQTAILALILAGSILGFLFFNWHPAKIFMGDAGSHFLGFVLAALAIISGGKIATAALVLGVPLIDFFWSLWRRWRSRRSLTERDLEHLHHRLLRLGLRQDQVVWIFVLLALLFGSLALLGRTSLKLLAFAFLVLLVVSFLLFLERPKKSKSLKKGS